MRVVRVTGELRDQTRLFVTGGFDLAILTYEKYFGLVAGKPDLLTRISVLVIDEIQTLALPDRGPALELLLTWIRCRRGTGPVPQVVGLSAVLGEAEELAQWLGAELVSTADRDVPLYEGVVTAEDGYCYLDDERREQVIKLVSADAEDMLPAQVVRALVEEGDQVIVFVAARRQAVDFATALAQELGLPAASDAIGALGGRAHGRLVEELLRCLKGGWPSTYQISATTLVA